MINDFKAILETIPIHLRWLPIVLAYLKENLFCSISITFGFHGLHCGVSSLILIDIEDQPFSIFERCKISNMVTNGGEINIFATNKPFQLSRKVLSASRSQGNNKNSNNNNNNKQQQTTTTTSTTTNDNKQQQQPL